MKNAKQNNHLHFNAYLEDLARQKKKNGKIRTAETYLSALHSLQHYFGRAQIPFTDLTASVLGDYQNWLWQRGVHKNTSSFYMRNIRAVVNSAVLDGKIPSQQVGQIFHSVYTGIDKTRKRSLSREDLCRIGKMALPEGSVLALARDLFLFSYYCRGMSFVDMAYLRPDNIVGGRLVYCRQKTGQQISLRWESCMQEIVERYAPVGSGYLLPIITRADENSRKQYLNAIFRTNNSLHVLSERLGIVPHLTTYVARHTWASLAYQNSIPIPVISESLGHDSESTTRIYLASLSDETLDKANAAMIRLLD